MRNELMKIAELIDSQQKTAAAAPFWSMFKNTASNFGNALGRKSNALLDSAGGKLENYLENTAPKQVRKVLRTYGNGLVGRDIRRGWGKIQRGMSGNKQHLFDTGMRQLATGVGKTGLAYGGTLYAGNKLYDAFSN